MRGARKPMGALSARPMRSSSECASCNRQAGLALLVGRLGLCAMTDPWTMASLLALGAYLGVVWVVIILTVVVTGGWRVLR